MKTLQLTDAECKVVQELLEEEQRELQPEIHHTAVRTVKNELKERWVTVNRLIERIKEDVG